MFEDLLKQQGIATAVAMTDHANSEAKYNFLLAYRDWMTNSEVLKSIGRVVPPKPVPPLMMHYVYVEVVINGVTKGVINSTEGPENVCDYPAVVLRPTEEGALDDVVGALRGNGKPGRYNLGRATDYATKHTVDADKSKWFLDAEGLMGRYWREDV